MPSPLCRGEAATRMLSRGVADDSYGGMTLARTVVVREVDALPCAEQRLAVTHRQRHVVPGQHTLDVRIGISLGVAELFLAWHELSEVRDEVPLNIGVRVLVHEHARGRVEHRDDADPILHLRA